MLSQLRQEADRRTKLEEDFRQCSESYHNLKTAKENTELTLDSLTDRLKLSEKTSHELQSIIDLMSSNSDGQKQKIQQAQSHLERENSKLTTRLRELEFECRQLRDSTAAPKDSGSSTVDPRMIWLEQENERLRQLSLEHQDELRTFTSKLTNLQTTLAKVENEKVANDRRMQAQINALQEKLEESGEELDYLRQQVGEASAAEREQQLMDRIDEDQAKIEQLVKLVDGSRKTEEALKRIEVTLKMETTKAIEAEARNVHLIREKEEALDALEKHRISLLEHERRIDQLQARER
jgi:chromosome segregation ATPase